MTIDMLTNLKKVALNLATALQLQDSLRLFAIISEASEPSEIIDVPSAPPPKGIPLDPEFDLGWKAEASEEYKDILPF